MNQGAVDPNANNYALRLVQEIASVSEVAPLIAKLSCVDLGIEDMMVYRLACRRLVCIEGGVEALYDVAWKLPRMKMQTAVLSTLWYAEQRQHVPVFTSVDSFEEALSRPISERTADKAAEYIRDLLTEAVVDSNRFMAVVQFAHQDLVFSLDTNVDPSRLASLLSESSIKLTKPMLRRFESLLHNQLPELRYQEFLASYPVFLDPLAAEVVDRHRLGDDLITDYIVRRHDTRYIAIEIEKPYDRMLTVAGNFTAHFTHAFGQVLDFLGWLDANVAYASKKLPGLEAPSGLLVMGSRATLSDTEQDKLRRFVSNSRRIDVVTFDDLLSRANNLYSSLHYSRPTYSTSR